MTAADFKLLFRWSQNSRATFPASFLTLAAQLQPSPGPGVLPTTEPPGQRQRAQVQGDAHVKRDEEATGVRGEEVFLVGALGPELPW